jgi:hypothetical protein
MTVEARPTDSAPERNLREEKCGERRKSLVMETPMMEERIWPRIAGRGCARGEEMVLYSRMAAAPFPLYISLISFLFFSSYSLIKEI